MEANDASLEQTSTEKASTEQASTEQVGTEQSGDRPSQTALIAAAARAAHLIVDHEPVIFADELAAPLLGEQADELIGYHRAHGSHLVLSCARAQVLCRSRFTEDHLAACVRGGITQYVILGAGLDSFAYRPASGRPASGRPGPGRPRPGRPGPGSQGLARIFEVDHPGIQRWKRAHLASAGITVPDTVNFVAVDFERDSLAGRLAQAGLDPSRPALVSWLGVTMYLTEAAISQTLAEISGFAPGTQLITDYMLPAALRDETGRSYAELVAPAVAERGEPWLTFLAPDDMSALLGRHGFGPVEHVRQRDSIPAALWDRTDSLHPAGLSLLARATLAGATRARTPLARATRGTGPGPG
ncbi:MAG TPA: class I SAM-dependent methyltransferase [Streptosporangiaceae bacterium]|nr:class I SAM-dependent methyltransferase [Streptosporangiaceae bacterium]